MKKILALTLAILLCSIKTFAATLTVYPDAGSPGTNTFDGTYTFEVSNDSFATARASTSNATSTAATESSGNIVYHRYVDRSGTDEANCLRTYYGFLTSDLPDTATVNSATVSIYGTAKSGALTSSGVNLYSHTVTSNTTINAADYRADTKWGSTAYSDTIAYNSFSTSGYNAFALNSTGIAAISKTSVTHIGLRETHYDVAGNSFPYENTLIYTAYFADQTGTTNDPKLVIDYTASYLDQKHFRIYDDDAAINSGTALANEDTNYYSNTTGNNIRIRFEVANTGTSATNITRRLEFKEDSGAWTQITTNSNNVRLSLSSNFADTDATTQRLTGVGTFTAGQGKESGSDTSQISLEGAYNVEDEYCVKFETGAESHTYQFRLSNAGVALDAYSQTPTIGPIAWQDVGGYFTPSSSTSTHVLHGTIRTSNASYPAHLRLYNITDAAMVTDSDISTAGTSLTEIDSDALSLTSGKQYKAQIGVSPGGTVYTPRTSYAP